MMTDQTKISFEFFPPKSKEGQETLYHTAETLQHYAPEFFSVTFGAGGSTRSGTSDTLHYLKKNTAIDVAPHLSCIGASKEELSTIIRQYLKQGVRRIVAIRGDLPAQASTDGDYSYALKLVELIREIAGESIEVFVAAYPEYHPECVSVKADILNLKQKQDAGASAAITQYFYNPDAYFHLLDECEKANIHIPIIAGVMPIINFKRLLNFSERCGAEIPRWLQYKLSHFDDTKAMQEFGAEFVSQLCERLIKGGVPGFHFYTLNQSDATKSVLERLGAVPFVMPAQKIAVEN